MTTSILQALGGVGLFLVGMLLLTDGMRRVIGDPLRERLRHSTRSPATGALWGALATAAIQSSSAVTVTAVGLVGASILSFPQALGIVFGANVGTTMTGWLVVLLGIKLKLGTVAPLLVLAGALLRLFGRGRSGWWGGALAGFGLLFVGLDMLQQGMSAVQGWLPLDQLPADTVFGRLRLVALGVAITLVTQSSSAGVAMAIAAVHTGALELGQAAAMVIGMDVGTTATAVLATVGGTVAARRTAWAHVVYNLVTGAGAFLLLPVYVLAVEKLWPSVARFNPEIALVAFHTLFNLMGVTIALSLAGRFAAGLERLIPARVDSAVDALDERLLGDRELAMDAVAATLDRLSGPALDLARAMLEGRQTFAAHDPEPMREALTATQQYLGRIPPPEESHGDGRRTAAFHVVDQLRRLLDRLEQRSRLDTTLDDDELRRRAMRTAGALRALQPGEVTDLQLEQVARELAEARPEHRNRVLRRASARELSPEQAASQLDAWRWLERITHHAWRLTHHRMRLHLTQEDAGPVIAEPREPD